MEKSYLLGLGFDCKDGHLRLTKGKNFRLYGGSEETHDLMQERVIKLNEQLEKRGKTLDNISNREFLDIAHHAGFEISRNIKAKNNKTKRQ